MFHPAGRIWDLATYKAVLAHRRLHRCEALVAAARSPSGTGCACATPMRPDFRVLTGNDLAIDMVMYGSDYLLGLSTFAPDLFAERDRCWAAGDPGFYELNDALQYLGNVAFRPPVPAYRHSAALFLRLRGWVGSDATPGRRAPPPARGARRCCASRGRAAGPAGDAAAAGRRSSGCRRPTPSRARLDELGIALPFADPPDGRRPRPRRSPSPAAPRRTASPSCRWRAGTAPTTAAPPTSCAGAGRASAPAAPGSCGAARRSPCAPTVGPTPASSASARRRPTTSPSSGPARARAGRRPPAHPLRPLGASTPRPGRTDPLLDARRTGAGADRRRARRARRRLRRRRPARTRRRASTSSTSRRATATSSTSCSAGPGAARRTGRAGSAPTIERVRAAAPGLAVGVRLSRVRRRRPTAPGRTASASPRPTGDALRLRATPLGAARPARRRPRLRHRRQPLLLPPRAAARLLPAQRRLPAARGPARRRGPAARRRRRPGRRPARTSPSSPAASPTSRSGCPTSPPRSSATRRRGAASASAAWRSSYPDLPADVLAGRPLDAPPPVPHVQRLHHRAAQRARVRLLAARRLLQGPARARGARRREAPGEGAWPVAEPDVRGCGGRRPRHRHRCTSGRCAG